METTEKQITLRHLQAAPGYCLTQKSDTISADQRVYSTEIWLGSNDTPDNWREIPVTERDTAAAAMTAKTPGATSTE